MNNLKFECPHCNQSLEVSGDVMGTTISCPSCQEAITLPRPSQAKQVPLSKTTSDKAALPHVQGLSKAALWSLLAVGCLLHVLFSAEGVFHPWNWDHPIAVFGIMVGYATPGILVSIMGIVPFFHYSLPKPRPKLPKMEHVVWSVYVGFALRMFTHFLSATQN